jgi:putative RecB family exonuclease
MLNAQAQTPSHGARRGRHPSSLSPTALRLYDQCPKAYAFAYVERAPADDPPSAHLVFGNALHEALAFLFRLPVDERSLEIVQQALRHYWMRQRDRDQAFLTRQEEATWGNAALEALELFCRNHAEELAIQPLAVEEWVRAPLQTAFSVAGKVDRVDRVSVPVDGDDDVVGLRVTDYKTGKCNLGDGDELADDRGAQVYALAATRTFRQPVVAVRFLYLREDRAVTWDVEREDLQALEERLTTATQQIGLEEEFEARPDFHCTWCKHRRICPEGSGQASVNELDPQPTTVF